MPTVQLTTDQPTADLDSFEPGDIVVGYGSMTNTEYHYLIIQDGAGGNAALMLSGVERHHFSFARPTMPLHKIARMEYNPE